MGSIMYGDIIPFTIAEETISLVQMLLGRVFISFMFAEIASYVSSQYSAYNNHMKKRNQVMKWVELNNVRRDLRKRVSKYFDFKWNNQRGIEEAALIKDMPHSLRKSVQTYIYEELI